MVIIMTSLIKSISSSINKAKADSRIRNNWDIFVDSIDKQAENKIEQKIEVIDIFIKHYGFDMLINLPYGYAFTKFRELLPRLELIYKGDIIAELSENKSCVYLRCHLKGLDIKDVDLIKFKWYKHFFSGQKFRNYYGETFKLTNHKRIYNVNQKDDKDKDKGVVGYEFTVNIPSGLKYSDLKSEEETLSFNIYKCLITKDKKRRINIKFITVPLSDNERFKPVKLKSPYDMYVGMGYDYKPIISNLQYSPHMLVTGKSQTGKTKSIVTSLTNLCYQFNDDKLQLFCSMISSKQDLRIFKGVSNLKYYANTIDKTIRLLKFLHNEMNRRNALFETAEKFCGSMYEWNEMYPNKRLPLLLASFDEMTLYMPKESEKKSKEPEIRKLYLQKLECIDLFTTLIVESASSGINIIFLLQRPDKESLPPFIKSQIGLKVGFYQPNSASSLVAMDSDSCSDLEMKREAIVNYEEGEVLMKTLYITNDDVQRLLAFKTTKNPKYYNFDKNGKIVKEMIKNDENILKNEQKSQKTEEIKSKSIENEQNYKKVWNSETKSFKNTRKVSQWEKYWKGKDKK